MIDRGEDDRVASNVDNDTAPGQIGYDFVLVALSGKLAGACEKRNNQQAQLARKSKRPGSLSRPHCKTLLHDRSDCLFATLLQMSITPSEAPPECSWTEWHWIIFLDCVNGFA
jgi:hypothetical protein